MIELIREKLITHKNQVILLNREGEVVASDNHLFPLKTGSSIAYLDPFFETITALINEENQHIPFNCVTIHDTNNKPQYYDVELHTGNAEENPFIIIYEFTEHYEYIQGLSQEKNELAISNHFEAAKNRQLVAEKAFKNKFLANISHDLRTPLGAILGFVDLLEKTGLNYEQHEMTETIRQTALHAKGLIDDLLDISKIEAGALKIENKTFDFKDLMTHLEKIYVPKIATKNLGFKMDIDSTIPNYLIGDKVRILQILINFLDNAYKFTHQGSITLKIKGIPIAGNDMKLQMEVIDTGIGFPGNKAGSKKEIQIDSFTKFHKTEIEGHGLGLSIVKKILDLMKGEMQIDSEEGKGTAIKVFIPVVVDDKVHGKKPVIKENTYQNVKMSKSYKLLVADDNEINQLLLTKILVKHGGFYIDAADNGREVLEKVAQKDYDLILMDIEMPEMDGLEATVAIKKHPLPSTQNTPVIGLSAHASDSLMSTSFDNAGMSGYIPKPYTREQLFEEMYRVLKIEVLPE
jgi:signal transduction histidine kinase/CheY-like chemotaxis protein